MTVTQDAVGRRVVLSPQEGLVAGGPAEEFEQRVQALFRNGSTDLLVDLRQVPTIDSRGVRALVRAHTSAQRLGATFRIACPCPAVQTILEVSKLDSVFVVYDTIDEAQKRDLRWDLVWTTMAGAALCAALVAGGLRWPLAGNPEAIGLPAGMDADTLAPQPFIALIKLVAAALIGMLVTAIHSPNAADAHRAGDGAGADPAVRVGRDDDDHHRQFARPRVRHRRRRQHRQVPDAGGRPEGRDHHLPADVAGDGLRPRRLRDRRPRHGVPLRLLYVLDRTSVRHSRALAVEVVAEGPDFPTDHVQGVFARNRVVFETREVSQGKETAVTYHALIDPQPVARRPSAQLMAGGSAGVRSVSWEQPKKGF